MKNGAHREDQILQEHLAVATSGFAALKRITDFCCIGCGLCASVCPEKSVAIDDTKKNPF
jgi:formate hydrogenlyase subunit 6/NADH:ubiquinone oxidoreductase subunit I